LSAALDVISVRRIAHGVRAVEDPAFVPHLDPEDAALDV
jgi:adenosine deaminase